MDGVEIARLRQALGMTHKQFAARIGVARLTVQRWERGVNKPHGLDARALEDLARATAELAEAVS